MPRRSTPMFASSRTSSGRGPWRVVAAILAVLVGLVAVWAVVLGGLWSYAWFQLGGDDIEALEGDVDPLGAGGAAAPATSTTVLVTLTGPVDPTIPRPPELATSPALVQVGGQREQPAVLVLPRELSVAVDGHGQLTFDEVQAEGGTDLMVRAVTDYTQVRIDHAVSLSIDALPRLAERFGDLEVCRPDGCETPTPDELRLTLSRGDEDRVVHEILGTLRAIGQRVDAGVVARSPLAARRVVDIVADEVRTDASLRGTTLLTLADAFASTRDVDLDRVPVLTDPASGDPLVLEEAAAVRFQHLREGTVFSGEPAEDVEADLIGSVELVLLNAAGVDGLAASVQTRLGAAGYPVAATGNARRFDRETTSVSYPSGDAEVAYVAALLADELDGATLEPLDERPTHDGDPVDILVLLGQDQAE